jgi:hypothetical protein
MPITAVGIGDIARFGGMAASAGIIPKVMESCTPPTTETSFEAAAHSSDKHGARVPACGMKGC